MPVLITSTDRISTEAIKTVILAFIFSRFCCGIFTYLGHFYRQTPITMPGVWEGIDNRWLNPWTTFDSLYYLDIASIGYQNLTAPFFPLYSLLLRLGGDSQIGMAIAGIVISNLAFAAALYFLHRLTEMDCGREAATTTVWILALFPTTVFFSAVYTESTFLLLLLLSFYSARRQKWLFAGIAGGLASLTRNPGALIFVALVLEYLREQEYSWKKLELPHLFFISLPLVSFVGVQAYLWTTLGSPMASVAAQQQFYRAPTWPWESVWQDLLGFFTYLDFDLVTFVNLVSIFTVIFLAIHYRQKLRPAYALLLAGLVLMNLAYAPRYPPHTSGTIRYLSTAFPFIQLLGYHATRPASMLHRYRLAIGGIYFYLCLLFSFLFGLKSFLG